MRIEPQLLQLGEWVTQWVEPGGRAIVRDFWIEDNCIRSYGTIEIASKAELDHGEALANLAGVEPPVRGVVFQNCRITTPRYDTIQGLFKK